MKKLLIATRNQGKLKEMLSALGSAGFEIIGLNEAGIPNGFDVEEPAMTLEGNAIIKAIAYGNRSGILTLADDTGLEVDAFGGRPGVYSARYAPGSDADRYRKLLRELEGVPAEKRTAQFRTVVAIYDPTSGKVRTCEGVYRGRILTEPRGTEGFGYDPIFFCEEKGKTNAQMTAEEKNEVSHRGLSLKRAKEILTAAFFL